MLRPHTRDTMVGLALEEELALIQRMCDGHSRAISTLSQLLRTPHAGPLCEPIPVTPALLRRDPIWDPLRSAALKTLRGKRAVNSETRVCGGTNEKTRFK